MDWSLVKDIGLFFAGLIIGPVVYFARRKIEKSSEHEDLEIKDRLLRINRELKDQNLTPEADTLWLIAIGVIACGLTSKVEADSGFDHDIKAFVP